MAAMALSTKGIVEWAAAVRNIFRVGDEPARDTRSPEGQQYDDMPIKDEFDDGGIAQPWLTGRNTEASNEETSSSGYQTQDEDVVEMVEISMEERMRMAKKRYPGAKDWARDEERLFEIMFSRQDLPMMPSHWSIDFRGVPLTERVFETSKRYPPVVYARGKNGMTDFAGKTLRFSSLRAE